MMVGRRKGSGSGDTMAVMYPSDFQDEMVDLTRIGFQREKEIFNLIKTQLSNQFYCFYSHRWKLTDNRKDQFRKHGEIDFILVHKDYGILLIEVKSGKPIIEADKEIYFQYSDKRINVFEKLETGKEKFYEVLKHSIVNYDQCNLGEAVFFPDTNVVEVIRDDYAKRLIQFKDKSNLEQRIIEIYQYFKGVFVMSLGALTIADISRVLEFRPKIVIPLAQKLNDIETKIEYQTKQQFNLLNLLKSKKRVLIKGGAGTGKTILAMEKARRLSVEGKKTLFLCYNFPLSSYLKKTYKFPNLSIKTYYRQCEDVIKEANLPVHIKNESKEYFLHLTKNYPYALEKVANYYDSIVIDEGQDFAEDDWWFNILYTLKDPDNGELYVFFDEYQAVQNNKKEGSILETILNAVTGIDKDPFTLEINLRNTKNIFSFAKKFYSGETELSEESPEGIPVELISIDRTNHAEISKKLSEIILKYSKNLEFNISLQDIAILTGNLENSCIKHEHIIGGFRLTKDSFANPNQILFETIRRFKGLERKLIILIEMDYYFKNANNTEYQNLLYIAATRAKGHLVIIGSDFGKLQDTVKQTSSIKDFFDKL